MGPLKKRGRSLDNCHSEHLAPQTIILFELANLFSSTPTAKAGGSIRIAGIPRRLDKVNTRSLGSRVFRAKGLALFWHQLYSSSRCVEFMHVLTCR